MADFLKHYLSPVPGDVLDENGTVIGTHEGALLYTIGQRRGFSTEKHTAHESSYVVIAKDLAQNTITVAHPRAIQDRSVRSSVHLTDLNEISPLDGADLSARIRYRGALHPVALTQIDRENRTALLSFKTPVEGVAAGQSVVFYRASVCVGGAVLDQDALR